MLSRSSFRTELDGSAKLLGGGGVRTHNQHTRIHRHHQLRAPIPCASAETEAMESPPARPHPVERGTILFLRGQINERERETGSTHARAARLTDDPILAHISMLGRPLASRIRRARSSIARARARDSGRPSSRRIPAYVERWKRGVLGCTENFDDE